jgi:hypothetical protein
MQQQASESQVKMEAVKGNLSLGALTQASGRSEDELAKDNSSQLSELLELIL